MATLLTDRYKSDLLGVLSCYDRIVITGTLPEICFAQGMTNYLKARQIKIFDYPKAFADPLRHTIRENAQAVADREGVAIEFVKSAHLRKEDLVAKVLNARGHHPGLPEFISTVVYLVFSLPSLVADDAYACKSRGYPSSFPVDETKEYNHIYVVLVDKVVPSRPLDESWYAQPFSFEGKIIKTLKGPENPVMPFRV